MNNFCVVVQCHEWIEHKLPPVKVYFISGISEAYIYSSTQSPSNLAPLLKRVLHELDTAEKFTRWEQCIVVIHAAGGAVQGVKHNGNLLIRFIDEDCRIEITVCFLLYDNTYKNICQQERQIFLYVFSSQSSINIESSGLLAAGTVMIMSVVSEWGRKLCGRDFCLAAWSSRRYLGLVLQIHTETSPSGTCIAYVRIRISAKASARPRIIRAFWYSWIMTG